MILLYWLLTGFPVLKRTSLLLLLSRSLVVSCHQRCSPGLWLLTQFKATLKKRTKELFFPVWFCVYLSVWVTLLHTLKCFTPSFLFEVSSFFFKYIQLLHLPWWVHPALLYGCAVREVVNTAIPNPDEGRGAGCSQPWSLRGILRDQSQATVTWPAALTPNTCGKEQNSLAAHSG